MATITVTVKNPSSFVPKRTKGQILVDWLTTTDHKKIGYLYLITSFLYFLLGGVMALVIRAQLALPGLEIVATKEQYNQLFTMHGTIMLLMLCTQFPKLGFPKHGLQPIMSMKGPCVYGWGKLLPS